MIRSELFQNVKEAISNLEIVLPRLEADGFNQDYLIDAIEKLKEYKHFLEKEERSWMQP